MRILFVVSQEQFESMVLDESDIIIWQTFHSLQDSGLDFSAH